MHKKTIVCLSLIIMFLLAPTTNISRQVVAIPDSAFKDQAGSTNTLELPDDQVICEECIKNWLDFLNTSQQYILLNALINAINIVNFDGIPCTSNTPPVDTGATCLTALPPGSGYTTAQMSEICENLKLALNYLVFVLDNPNQKEALAIIENAVKSETDQDIAIIVQGLFDCLDRVLLPLTFTCKNIFEKFLTADELTNFLHYLSILEPHSTNNLKEYCQLLANLQEDGLTTYEIKSLMFTDFSNAGIADKLSDVIDSLQTIRFLR
jgi:hypothetical protein